MSDSETRTRRLTENRKSVADKLFWPIISDHYRLCTRMYCMAILQEQKSVNSVTIRLK